MFLCCESYSFFACSLCLITFEPVFVSFLERPGRLHLLLFSMSGSSRFGVISGNSLLLAKIITGAGVAGRTGGRGGSCRCIISAVTTGGPLAAPRSPSPLSHVRFHRADSCLPATSWPCSAPLLSFLSFQPLGNTPLAGHLWHQLPLPLSNAPRRSLLLAPLHPNGSSLLAVSPLSNKIVRTSL